jgi:dTDP-4-dehydrorhamnose 3,5-epimerase
MIIETKLNGLVLLEPKVYTDKRGFFYESFHIQRYRDAGIKQQFVQDNISHSKKGVLRGLHYQLKRPQAKLVSVIRGAALDVVVDIRQGSSTFGQYQAFELNDQNHHQLYVPEGYAHGFVALSDEVDFCYKCTDYYQPGDEFGICWNDTDLNINWGVNNPIIADRDQAFPRLAEVAAEHLPLYQGIL